MQNVSNLSILTMLIMYMLSALFGYLTFYGKEKIVQKGKEKNISITALQHNIYVCLSFLRIRKSNIA